MIMARDGVVIIKRMINHLHGYSWRNSGSAMSNFLAAWGCVLTWFNALVIIDVEAPIRKFLCTISPIVPQTFLQLASNFNRCNLFCAKKMIAFLDHNSTFITISYRTNTEPASESPYVVYSVEKTNKRQCCQILPSIVQLTPGHQRHHFS